jgi:hypothetical protein
MWGLYYWRDLNIYLLLFRALLENKNQPRLRHDNIGEVILSGNLSIFSHLAWPVPKNAMSGRYLA